MFDGALAGYSGNYFRGLLQQKHLNNRRKRGASRETKVYKDGDYTKNNLNTTARKVHQLRSAEKRLTYIRTITIASSRSP